MDYLLRLHYQEKYKDIRESTCVFYICTEAGLD